MQFTNQSLMRMLPKGAGIIPKRYQLNNVMCFWWINKTETRVCVGSSSRNGASSLPEAFRLSEPACSQQHHLPGKLRRTEFQQELLHTSQRLGWAVWKMPQTRAPKGHSPPAAAASVLPVPRKAAQWSLEEFSKDKSSPANSGVFHLDSGAHQAISSVLTEKQS